MTHGKNKPIASDVLVLDEIHAGANGLGNEGGMMTIFSAIMLMYFTLLIAVVLNVGHICHKKIELQNNADAIAFTGGLWHARGLNAITATNHVIGEMMSFVILHEAVGGKRLDGVESSAANTRNEDRLLDTAYSLTSLADQNTYELVRQRGGVFADRTLLDSKKQLKKKLAYVYFMLAAAEAMQRSSVPPVVAAGIAIELVMKALELVIRVEYQILKTLHAFAKELVGLKVHIRDFMLPVAKDYTTLIMDEIPSIAEGAARRIAELNGCEGSLAPVLPRLPLVLDPHAYRSNPVAGYYQHMDERPTDCPSVPATDMRDQLVKTSQLARATWPWVNYHRKPILDALSVLQCSGASEYYFEHTAGAAKELLNHLQDPHGHNLGLYVLKGYGPLRHGDESFQAPDKGYEPWTEDPELANELFGIVGLAYQPRPSVIGAPTVFYRPHPNGRLAISQALIYNANEQQPKRRINLSCKRIVPIRQANVGWDTLNWKPKPNPPSELIGIGAIGSEFPEIQVNWQVKLVPLSTDRLQLVRSSTAFPPKIQGLVGRLLPSSGNAREDRILRTH